MKRAISRRHFVKDSVLAGAGSALALNTSASAAQPATNNPATSGAIVPKGKIGKLEVSRMLLGGNLLTHFTHSRDLKYVYALTRHYNTKEKIFETMALAEAHGINTLVIHTAVGVLEMMKEYRKLRGGKMQWIICPTAPIEPGLEAFSNQIQTMVDDGTDAIYIWGVRADALVSKGQTDLIAKAVDIVKTHGIMCGVGAHDLNVVKECERLNVPHDFYIKTFHHHNYPSAPRPDELKGANSENPGYWCRDPKETAEVMAKVEKPWISFKVMAAGAIPPRDAFKYVFQNGADFTLAGMFDFEIAEDAKIVNEVLAGVKQRARPWRG